MDSILHFICSFIIANSIYLFLYKITKYNRFKAIRYGFYITLYIGFGKEIYDMIFKGFNLVDTASDLLFNFLGIIVFLAVVIFNIEKRG